jgi:hypothetical protein
LSICCLSLRYTSSLFLDWKCGSSAEIAVARGNTIGIHLEAAVLRQLYPWIQNPHTIQTGCPLKHCKSLRYTPGGWKWTHLNYRGINCKPESWEFTFAVFHDRQEVQIGAYCPPSVENTKCSLEATWTLYRLWDSLDYAYQIFHFQEWHIMEYPILQGCSGRLRPQLNVQFWSVVSKKLIDYPQIPNPSPNLSTNKQHQWRRWPRRTLPSMLGWR